MVGGDMGWAVGDVVQYTGVVPGMLGHKNAWHKPATGFGIAAALSPCEAPIGHCLNAQPAS